MTHHSPSRLHRFIAELRRRHVVRVGLGYAAVLFVVLQLSEIILPAFLRNAQADEVMRILVVGGVLLLPIVLAMAWIYEITPQGIRSMADLDAEAGIPEQGRILPRFAFLAVTVLATGAAGLWWWQSADSIQRPTTGFGGGASNFQAATTLDASGPIRSIAVLPLEDQSAREGDEYFAASMHEALVSQISQNSSLRVISRTSVVRYDQTGKSITRMGADLGVDAIVEGSVLLVEGSVRVTVQLIHAASDTHLWARDYTRDLTDIIALQREVATAIAAEIGMQVMIREPGMGDRVATNDVGRPAIGEPDTAAADAGTLTGPEVRAPPATPSSGSVPSSRRAPSEAQLSNLRARFLLEGGAREFDAAEGYFTRALESDPNFVSALVGLAGLHLIQGLGETGHQEVLVELTSARSNAQRALALDPDNQEALDVIYSVDEALSDFASRTRALGVEISAAAADGTVYLLRGQDSTSVLTFGRDTIRFDTQGTRAVNTELGRLVQERMGMSVVQSDRTLREGEPSRDLRTAALRLAGAGRTEDAIRALEQATTARTPDWRIWELQEQLQRAEGQFEAVAATRLLRRDVLGQEPGPSLNALRRDVERSGLPAYWRWKQAEYRARREAGEPVYQTFEAAAHAALGQTESALTALAGAVEQRESALATLRVDPVWDDLRSEPRFQNLLRDMQVRFQREDASPVSRRR